MIKCLIFFSIFCIQLNYWAQGINFEKGTFEEVKTKAKQDNKLIFVDAYTSWCGPCKWMAATVFTNDTVGKFFNDKFLSIKMDMEKGEGIEFAKKYNVRCFPNLLILNSEGEVIHRQGGGLKAKAFIQFAEKALKGGNKTYQYYASNLSNQKNNLAFLMEYIDYLGHTCLPIDETISMYFDQIDSVNYTERKNWNMIWNFTNNFNSKSFKYLLNHQNDFAQKYTQDSVDIKINSVIQKTSHKFIHSKPIQENELNNFIKLIENLNIRQSKSAVFLIKLELYIKNEDWGNYEKELISKGDELLNKSQYNATAWNIYEKSSNTELLKKAANWMKNLTDSQPEKSENYAELDTYACVLYKLKNKEEALKIAQKAVEKAKKMGMNESQYQETSELISKINAL